MARTDVLSLQAGSRHLPDSVIAAAHDEQSLRRLKWRIRLWHRLGLVR
jgi:hypothetical protein